MEKIASGLWDTAEGSGITKSLKGVSGLTLYETKLLRGSRLLWEKAVSFSPRRSSVSSGGGGVVFAEVRYTQDIRPPNPCISGFPPTGMRSLNARPLSVIACLPLTNRNALADAPGHPRVGGGDAARQRGQGDQAH